MVMAKVAEDGLSAKEKLKIYQQQRNTTNTLIII